MKKLTAIVLALVLCLGVLTACGNKDDNTAGTPDTNDTLTLKVGASPAPHAEILEKAKELLGNTTLKNYEIAEKVGFSDPHYFGISFKKMTGKTPTEYAREKRK